MEPPYTYLLWYCVVSFGLMALVINRTLPEAPLWMKLVTVVTSPLLAPWFALQLVSCVTKSIVLSQSLQVHRRIFSDYQYLLLPEGEVEAELGGQFDEFTFALREQQFHFAGDYLMRTEPYRLISRVLWNEEGTLRATITSCLNMVGVELSTILSDGTNVVTTSIDTSSLRPQAIDLLILGDGNTDSISELIVRHQQAIEQAQFGSDRQVLAFDPSQSVACIRYNHRLFYQWRHRLGESTAPPPAELPAHRPLASSAML